MVNLSNRIIISRIFLTQFIVQVNVHYCSLLEMCAHDIVNRARTTYNVFEFIHVSYLIFVGRCYLAKFVNGNRCCIYSIGSTKVQQKVKEPIAYSQTAINTITLTRQHKKCMIDLFHNDIKCRQYFFYSTFDQFDVFPGPINLCVKSGRNYSVASK